MDKELSKKLLALYKDEELEYVEEGEWVQDYKYQHSTDIVKYEDKFYAVHQSRSGSYHTDWYYDDPIINEVRLLEKVITVKEWVPVA